VPIGGALDAEPVDFAFLVDIGQPRHFRVFGVAVLDQRMQPGHPEAASESGNLCGTQVLISEHQYWVLGERAFDPVERCVIERLREIDPTASVPNAVPSGRNFGVFVISDPPKRPSGGGLVPATARNYDPASNYDPDCAAATIGARASQPSAREEK